jgi:AraC-like DNA-binding protein
VPIERIAAAHGLRNASAFARLFRSVEGVTPREYRAAALGQARAATWLPAVPR